MPSLTPPVVVPGTLAALAQPTLVTAGLVLRPWTAADAPGVVAAYDDPEIRRWHVRTMSLDEAVDWTTSQSAGWREESLASWAVVDSRDALLGRVGLQQLSLHEGFGKAAYWVVPAARGHGVAARALSAVTSWAFDDLGMHRLQLRHSVHNPASCRVASKAGYALEGTSRSHGLHADGWHDMHVHASIAPPV